METIPVAKARVEVPFRCPHCAGENGVNLIELSRASGVACSECAKWLRVPEVMRAIHSPRPPRDEPARTFRGADKEPRPARDLAVDARAGGRSVVPHRDRIVWPPTAATRAAAKLAADKAAARAD